MTPINARMDNARMEYIYIYIHSYTTWYTLCYIYCYYIQWYYSYYYGYGYEGHFTEACNGFFYAITF